MTLHPRLHLLPGGQSHRADAFDGNLAAFPLRAGNGRKAGVQRERPAAMGALEADEELVPAYRRIADRQHHTGR